MEYTILDSVLMRAPIGHMGGLKEEIPFEIILNDKIFMEALAFSNREVFRAVQQRINQQLINTITKYYIRYKYRSTPYGFFSGVSNCRFDKDTKLVRSNDKKVIKDIKVDYEWFYKVLKVLEGNVDILDNVEVKISENYYSLGNRLINPCFSNYGEIEEETNTQKDICRIKYSNQVQNVETIARDWINYKKLIIELSIINKDVPETVLRNFVGKLINNSFLITSLRVPLITEDPLENLLKVITQFKVNNKNKEFIQRLVDINKMRIDYCKLKLGEGTIFLFELMDKMEKISPSKDYLGAIVKIPLEENTISIEVKKELENLGKLISAFEVGDNEGRYIYQYKKIFVEKYGTNTEIPFLEVIDETVGIGNPYTKVLEQDLALSAKTENLRKVILDKICLCLKHGKNKIILDEKDIDYFRNFKDEKNENLEMVSTFDLGVEIYATSEREINQGDFTIALSPGLGAPNGGQLVNRFYNLFDDFTRTELKKMYDCAMDSGEYIIVDTSCFHPKARANNICTGNKNYLYNLDIQIKSNGKDNINLRDIFIGYDQKIDRLYLRSQKYKSKLKVLGDYMLNPETLSHTIRTLWEISSTYEKNSLESLAIILESLSKYTPQICFGKTVLVNEQWCMETTDFEDIKSFKIFCDNFKEFAIDWKMPRYILLAIRDRTLLVDTENDFYLPILHKEIEKQLKLEGKVKIERAKQIDNKWQKDIHKKFYSSEYVVHFIKEPEKSAIVNSKIETSVIDKSVQSFYDKDRVFQPGEKGWFYFNIYLEEKKADEFLRDYLYSLVKELMAEKNVEKVFFIRYADPEFHIRFRIKLLQGKEKKVDILEKFLSWFESVWEQGYSYKFTLTPYLREVERYGGMESIEVAETFFCYESIFTLELLSTIKEQEEMETVVIFLLVDTLSCLYDGQMKLIGEYLDNFIEQKDFRKEFSKVRKGLLNSWNDGQMLEQLMQTNGFYLRKEMLIEYSEILKNHENEGTLTNYKEDTIMSILHMFCNRMNGNRYWEKKMLTFARHIIHDLNSREEYLNSRNAEKSRKVSE